MQIRRLAVSAAIVAALAIPESKEERAIRALLSYFRWMQDDNQAAAERRAKRNAKHKADRAEGEE